MNTIYEVVGPENKTIATFCLREDAEYYILHEYPLGRIVTKDYYIVKKKIGGEK